MLPAAILVDQDGTMIDSEPIWERAERAMTESLGGVLTPEAREKMIGGPLRDTALLMLELSGADVDPADIENRLVAEVARLVGEDVPWMEAAPGFLARAGEMGVPVGLVTSSWRRITEVVAAAAPAPGFAAVVAGDDVARPKPAPDAYLEGARRFGAPIERCLIVEDSPTGIRAAVASGAVVAVVPGVVEVPLSEEDSRFASLDELTGEVVERLMAGERFDLV